jgi:Tfp pilus assembly protein PilV
MTLVDVIATMVLIAIAVPPMMIALRDSAQRYTDNYQRIAARWLAAEQLETILADRSHAGRGYAYVTTANYTDQTIGPFARSTTVTEVSTNLSATQAGSGVKRVTVQIQWNALRSPQTLQLATVITDYTP